VVPKVIRNPVVHWGVVLTVGITVVAVVLGLRLIPRLNAGQHVLDSARPAFTRERVATDRAGIDIVSKVVDLADPIVDEGGGAAAEVPAVVGYVAKQDKLSQAKALDALRTQFPHTTALLESLPLSNVSTEIPKLVSFLASTLKMTPSQVEAALAKNFPAINRAVTHLPTVTNGWQNIANIGPLTRFDGTPVRSVPQVRDYFSQDVIPAVDKEQRNFRSLDGRSSVNWIAPLLLVVGIVVILLAGVMMLRHRKGVSGAEAMMAAAVVPVVGVTVVALVFGLRLIPRVSDGQHLLDGLAPAMTADRVSGDRAGIDMVSAIVDTADPIMTDKGGAAAEVPKLVSFVSQQSGLTQAEVLTALTKNFPHTTALLQALPLTAVAAELPAVTKALRPALPSVPHIAQAVTALPRVTGGWLAVPGTDHSTRFDGSPIRTVPQVRDYFAGDVIPVLERQHKNFNTLNGTSNIDFIGPLVLTVGIVVIVFGLFMVQTAARPAAPAGKTSRSAPRRQSMPSRST
jgi:hypothetical protein